MKIFSFASISLLLICSTFLFASQIPDALRELAQLKQSSNPARLEALQKILQERRIPFVLQTFESEATPHGRTKGTNLIMTFGNGPNEITLGAHYDALELNNGGMIDGMVDNGAATIILIRVAEALKNQTLRHRVRVILYDMEETGLSGSKAYVAAHKSDIAAAINLDIAGFGDAAAFSPGLAPGTIIMQKAFRLVCAEQLLTCLDFPNFPPSDDRSYWDANIPVISIALVPRIMLFQGWLMMNAGDKSGLKEGLMPQAFTIIHTPEDNISKIEPAALDLGFQLLLKTVLKLDAELQ